MSISTESQAGYSADGSRYIVRNVDLMDQADSDLWNDRMYVQADQRGRMADAFHLDPNPTRYGDTLRSFYIRDDQTGNYWSAPHDPVMIPPTAFEFSAGDRDITWHVETDGIAVDLQLVIPRHDNVELWTATVTNCSRRKRALSVYPYFPFGKLSRLAEHVVYDPTMRAVIHTRFDYYVQIPDYYRLSQQHNLSFFAADHTPKAHCLSRADFTGKAGLHAPQMLSQSLLSARPGVYSVANEFSTAIYQYSLHLRPGEHSQLQLAFGPARDRKQIQRIIRRYLSPGGIARELKAQLAESQHSSAPFIETPDTSFNHFINHWQSRRSRMLVRTLRFNPAPQGRNAIQDSMGGVYVDAAAARNWLTRIWTHQHSNGWMPHGLPFVKGVKQFEINAIPHKDLNSWGAPTVDFYINETGDESILDTPVPFADKPETQVSLYEHICLGLEWLLRDQTRRKLCRIGQGDWDDPLNMAGHHERGESTWLTEATILALDIWANVADRRNDTSRARRYRQAAQKSRAAINRYAWDGQWYARGFTDAGKKFGTRSDKEGKIFLNAQSWALIAGVPDATRSRQCIRAVESWLMTPSGPMTLAPAFTHMREDIGKLSQKVPGWNENGSVYCHAATFYAYSLFVAREPDRGYAVLRSLLPGTPSHPLKRAGQIPVYVPNFYRGTSAGPMAGLSSHSPNTGTAAWYYRTVIGMLLGIRGEFTGLRIDPQLPSRWKWARMEREWRGAHYSISIRRRKTGSRKGTHIMLDGHPIEGTLLPIPQPGMRHTVIVTID